MFVRQIFKFTIYKVLFYFFCLHKYFLLNLFLFWKVKTNLYKVKLLSQFLYKQRCSLQCYKQLHQQRSKIISWQSQVFVNITHQNLFCFKEKRKENQKGTVVFLTENQKQRIPAYFKFYISTINLQVYRNIIQTTTWIQCLGAFLSAKKLLSALLKRLGFVNFKMPLAEIQRPN